MNPEIVKLDLEGEICPYTLIRTIKKVEDIREDLLSKRKVLEVTYDHPPVIDNIPGEIQKRGFQVSIEKIGPARYRGMIKK